MPQAQGVAARPGSPRLARRAGRVSRGAGPGWLAAGRVDRRTQGCALHCTAPRCRPLRPLSRITASAEACAWGCFFGVPLHPHVRVPGLLLASQLAERGHAPSPGTTRPSRQPVGRGAGPMPRDRRGRVAWFDARPHTAATLLDRTKEGVLRAGWPRGPSSGPLLGFWVVCPSWFGFCSPPWTLFVRADFLGRVGCGGESKREESVS